jgi:hypothetical protein
VSELAFPRLSLAPASADPEAASRLWVAIGGSEEAPRLCRRLALRRGLLGLAAVPPLTPAAEARLLRDQARRRK